MADLKAQSRLNDRYQTTIPRSVRDALNLRKRDKVRFEIRTDETVVLSRVAVDGDDAALSAFLSVLADDIANRPEHLRAIDGALVERIRAVVGSADLDLNASLAGKDG